MANVGRVSLNRVITGRFQNDDWSRIVEACESAASWPLFINDAPALTLLEIRAKARQVQQQAGGLALVVVDYLQLAASSGGRQPHHQIEQISRGLKSLAKDLGCPVLVLSQLNAGERESKEPDAVRPARVRRDRAGRRRRAVPVARARGSPEGGSCLVGLKVEKNRQGKRGRFGLDFDGRTPSARAQSIGGAKSE